MTFYELTGEDARVKLERLAEELGAGTTELLESSAQPGLFLLVCRSAEMPATLPAGTKVWQFRQVG